MKFLTFRRYHLDYYLLNETFSGDVLDIGGKKHNKRGSFIPPVRNVRNWKYLNVDNTTNPDFCCNADSIPVKDCSFDIVLMCEIIEHLEKPIDAIIEARRVLKDGGKLILSIPFLYAIHGDPDDYQRWTPSKIKMEMDKNGFENINIFQMGGLFAVIYDLIHISLNQESKNFGSLKNKIMRRTILPIILKIFFYLDKKYIYKSKSITTGYYINAKKTSF